MWCLVLAVLALGPALGPGFSLSYDMVFVPRLDLSRDLFGLGDELPRAVPVDALVALLTHVLPGDLLQKAVLLGSLLLAGVGAARLVPTSSHAVRAVAATCYVWNPYVAERLVIGHWALLVAYATLPWLVRSADRVRAGAARAAPATVLLLALCAITPTGGLLGLLVAACVLLVPARVAPVRRATSMQVLGLGVVVNCPWWVPGLLHPGGAGAVDGAELFAARGENVLGPVGALAGLGGIWNAQVVPGSRETLLGVVGTALLLGLAAAGARTWWRRTRAPIGRGVLAAATLGFAIALAGVVPVVDDGWAWLVSRSSAAGLFRDGQKWVAPLALLLALLVALGVERLAARVADPAARRLVPGAAVVLLLAALPDLVWGATGRLAAVDYPEDWARARAVLTSAEGSGDVVALPWSTFRAFGWNDDRTVLDPATRFLPGSVVTDDDLPVGTRVVAGEGTRSAATRAALAQGDTAALARLGIGWVLVEKGQPGRLAPPAAARPVLEGPQLRLLRLPGRAEGRPLPGSTPVVVAADLLAAAAVLGAALMVVWRKLPQLGYPLVQSRRRGRTDRGSK